MRRVTRVLVVGFVLAAAACGTATPVPDVSPSVDVSGRWRGVWLSVGSPDRGEVDLTLDQRGARARGDLQLTATRLQLGGPVDGTVAGRVLRFHQPGGPMSGDLTVEQDRMRGLVQGGVLPRTFDLRREK